MRSRSLRGCCSPEILALTLQGNDFFFSSLSKKEPDQLSGRTSTISRNEGEISVEKAGTSFSIEKCEKNFF